MSFTPPAPMEWLSLLFDDLLPVIPSARRRSVSYFLEEKCRGFSVTSPAFVATRCNSKGFRAHLRSSASLLSFVMIR
jgi:hypothetical protein